MSGLTLSGPQVKRLTKGQQLRFQPLLAPELRVSRTLGVDEGTSIAGEDTAVDMWTSPDLAQPYVPGPVDVGWEIWVGFAAGIIPFLIGSWEFGKRIVSP
jgi:hypothetical protein